MAEDRSDIEFKKERDQPRQKLEKPGREINRREFIKLSGLVVATGAAAYAGKIFGFWRWLTEQEWISPREEGAMLTGESSQEILDERLWFSYFSGGGKGEAWDFRRIDEDNIMRLTKRYGPTWPFISSADREELEEVFGAGDKFLDTEFERRIDSIKGQVLIRLGIPPGRLDGRTWEQLSSNNQFVVEFLEREGVEEKVVEFYRQHIDVGLGAQTD